MSIGSITSTGKQNVASGGGLYRVHMRGYARIGSSSYDVSCFAIVSRLITSINDMANYILGGASETGTAYYPCGGVLTYPTTALSVFTVVTGFRASTGDQGTLSLKGVCVYGSNSQTALSVNVTSISCIELGG